MQINWHFLILPIPFVSPLHRSKVFNFHTKQQTPGIRKRYMPPSYLHTPKEGLDTRIFFVSKRSAVVQKKKKNQQRLEIENGHYWNANELWHIWQILFYGMSYFKWWRECTHMFYYALHCTAMHTMRNLYISCFFTAQILIGLHTNTHRVGGKKYLRVCCCC